MSTTLTWARALGADQVSGQPLRARHAPPCGITRRALGWRAASALAGGGLAWLPAACVPGQPGAAPEAGQPQQPTAVDYWSFYNEERLAPVRPHLAAWEQRAPYIRANVTITLSMNDLHEKIRVSVAAGTPPDAAMSPRYLAAWLNDSGALLNLAPLLRRDRITIEYVNRGRLSALLRSPAAGSRLRCCSRRALAPGADARSLQDRPPTDHQQRAGRRK